MSKIYYDGLPLESVDFVKESQLELEKLEKNIEKIKEKLKEAEPDSYAFRYWTLKMTRANEELSVPKITTD